MWPDHWRPWHCQRLLPKQWPQLRRWDFLWLRLDCNPVPDAALDDRHSQEMPAFQKEVREMEAAHSAAQLFQEILRLEQRSASVSSQFGQCLEASARSTAE